MPPPEGKSNLERAALLRAQRLLDPETGIPEEEGWLDADECMAIDNEEDDVAFYMHFGDHGE